MLPVRLQQSYEEAATHPQLLSVRHDVAACESLLEDAFRRLDSGESGAIWAALQQALSDFETAERRRETEAMAEHLATMRGLIRRGFGESAVIEDIRKLWDSRCKLTLTEQKTLIALDQVMTKEQLTYYLGAITDALTRHVTAHTDAATRTTILSAFVTELAELVSR